MLFRSRNHHVLLGAPSLSVVPCGMRGEGPRGSMRSFRIRLVLFFFLPLFLGVGRGRRGGETSLSCWTAISAFTFFRLCTLFWIRFGYAFVGGEEDTRLAMEMDMARVWYLSLRCERRAVGSVRGEDSSGAGFSSSLREHVSACASGTLAPNSLGNRKAEQSAEHRTKAMTCCKDQSSASLVKSATPNQPRSP